VSESPNHKSKIERNAPCPCGKRNNFGPVKYKRCCGRGVKAPRTPTTPVIKFLRETTFPFAWGEEKILTTTTQSFVNRYNRGERRSLTNGDFNDHFNGIHKLYFYGNPAWMTRKLCMIDIDVQKSKKLGSQKGAVAFAKHVDSLFAQWNMLGTSKGQPQKIYWEPSSSGVGLAGYLVITGANNDSVRPAYDHLETLLKVEAVAFDIEGVEVKGKPPAIEYGERDIVGNPQIREITFGSLAKYPTKATIENLRVMPEVHFDEILPIPVPIARVKPAPQVLSEKKIVSQCSCQNGSYAPLKKEYLEELPAFRRMASWLFPQDHWTTPHLVTEEDLAIQLFILWYLTKTEGDLEKPVERQKAIWTALHKDKWTNRKFSYSRHAAMRNGCSDLGLLHWHDHQYYMSHGKTARGKACQYSANDKFMELLAKCQQAERIFGSNTPTTPSSISPLTSFPLLSRVRPIRPKRIENPNLPVTTLVMYGDIEPFLYEWSPERKVA